MWHIENPFKVFNYVYTFDKSKDYNFLAIIGEDKYFSFPEVDRHAIERIPEISILDKNIKNPDNPAIMKRVKVITFSR